MTDLSGRWRGIFDYPAELPATAFAADLRDAGGVITGSIEEPDILRSGRPDIRALIEGRREGGEVRFVKFYEAGATGYDAVAYHGAIARDGDEITGRWDITGAWSGTFLMIREAPAPVAAEKAAAAAR